MALTLTILVTFFLFTGSKRKGYNPFLWLFAGGLFGYAVLAFLPDTSPVMGHERKGSEGKRKRGNIIGTLLTVMTLGFHAFLILALGII